MGIEAATKIADLNALWPLSTDPKSQGDDHFRLIKAVLQADALSLADGGDVAGPMTFSGGISGELRLTDWDPATDTYGFLLAGGTLSVGAGSGAGASSNNIGGYWGGTLTFAVRRNGNAVNTNNSYGAISDERLKEDVTPATPKLDDLLRLEIVNFALKADPTGAKQIGVVAQQAQQVFPGLVETGDDGFLSFKYSVLVPMLVKAVQELAARVEALEARG